MKNKNCFFQLAICAAAMLPVLSAMANPLEPPEKPLTIEISFLIVVSIVLEAVCISLVLRRSRKPRFFILWLVGLHVITYPAFLGFLWLTQTMRPAVAAGIGEGLVVLVEGTLIYLICRFIPSAKPASTKPSVLKCLLASLIGNCVSAAAFPILAGVFEKAARIIYRS